MKKYLITVKAEIEMYVDAENEDNAYDSFRRAL